MSNENTKKILNQSVADLSVATALIHQTHWYMRGAGFLKLHPYMDKLMDGLNDVLDELSERLITIGGSPVSTLKEFDELSKIDLQPTDWNVSMKDRLAKVLATYKYLAEQFQEGIDAASEEGDAVTEGLYTDAKGDVEKTIWMLDAELADR
ncbi:Dps family protein [Lactococcus termiticola]|uniref:DNA-binding ferritin-like protein n=1 Tax=Lactococcus termiticola TaxID=2169526 RepID=A0A2R5HIX0_9LACT|nr:Dps family protein [Lactococcus termiticola]GBG96051.1 DNA-binding ferritin-like protein [Lactococcus termiticola]